MAVLGHRFTRSIWAGNLSGQSYDDVTFQAIITAQQYTDAGTVYLDLQPSGVDIRERTDSATVLLDLQVLGGECFSTFSGLLLGEGEAELRWESNALLRWLSEAGLRWSSGEIIRDGINC